MRATLFVFSLSLLCGSQLKAAPSDAAFQMAKSKCKQINNAPTAQYTAGSDITSLRSCAITSAEQIAQFAEFSSLTELTGDDNQAPATQYLVQDTDLGLLSSMPRLEKLQVMVGAITDAGIAVLSTRSTLRRFNFSYRGGSIPALTPAAYGHLSNMPLLETISLPNAPDMTDEILEQLSRLTHGQSISINGPVTAVGFSYLKNMPELKIVRTVKVSVTPDIMQELSQIRTLTTLRINRSTPVTDETLSAADVFPELRKLVIADTDISDAPFTHSRFPMLREFVLFNQRSVSAQSRARIEAELNVITLGDATTLIGISAN